MLIKKWDLTLIMMWFLQYCVNHDMRYDIEVFMCAEIDVTLHHLLYILYLVWSCAKNCTQTNFNLELNDQYSIQFKNEQKNKTHLLFTKMSFEPIAITRFQNVKI